MISWIGISKVASAIYMLVAILFLVRSFDAKPRELQPTLAFTAECERISPLITRADRRLAALEAQATRAVRILERFQDGIKESEDLGRAPGGLQMDADEMLFARANLEILRWVKENRNSLRRMMEIGEEQKREEGVIQ